MNVIYLRLKLATVALDLSLRHWVQGRLMAEDKDLASQSLEAIAKLWQVDKNRSKWSHEGFEWWPGDYRVSVLAQSDARHREPETYRLVIKTDFLKEVPVQDERFSQWTAMSSRFMTSTYAWAYTSTQILKEVERWGPIEGQPKMWLASTAYVNAEKVEWMPRLLAQMAIMQPINAQIQAKAAPRWLHGGTPDISRPAHLRDAGLDDILEVAAQVYVPIGKESNRWSGHDEFSQFAENYARNDHCFGTGDETGLTLETPFGSDTALINLRTGERHPQLGNGLLVTLQLPRFAEAPAIASECAYLNFLEAVSWTDFPLFGCWHPQTSREGSDGLAFSTFVPNALYQPMLATNFAFWMLDRARWARETLWPELRDSPMIEILEKRFGSASTS